MTQPKARLAGTAYFLTSVCERHEFRLRPSAETNAAFAFTLMESAMRHGIDVIAVCQMSSHYHAVVFDRLGRLSEFLRDFHGLMGRYGSFRDRVENTRFWGDNEAGQQVLGDVETIIEKVAYTLANPTKDFIVARPEEWIGVRTPVEAIGAGWWGRKYDRPKRFFDEEGWTAEDVMLSSDWPWELEERIPLEAFRERVRVRVEEYVAEASAAVAAGQGRFLGVAEAKKYSVWHRAEGSKGRTAGRAAKTIRRVAAATKGRLSAMADALLAFRKAHREAREAFRGGAFDTVFPAGTWAVSFYYGAARAEGVGELAAAPG